MCAPGRYQDFSFGSCCDGSTLLRRRRFSHIAIVCCADSERNANTTRREVLQPRLRSKHCCLLLCDTCVVDVMYLEKYQAIFRADHIHPSVVICIIPFRRWIEVGEENKLRAFTSHTYIAHQYSSPLVQVSRIFRLLVPFFRNSPCGELCTKLPPQPRGIFYCCTIQI